jgi:hypothetical protein
MAEGHFRTDSLCMGTRTGMQAIAVVDGRKLDGANKPIARTARAVEPDSVAPTVWLFSQCIAGRRRE